MEDGDLSVIFLSLAIAITSITMFAACLCCRKKVQSNELRGLEGMVKIRNPDDNILNGHQSIPINESEFTNSTIDITDSRRSIVGHRSLPDIPTPDKLDTGSDLYATVCEKAGDVHRTQNPSLGITKQINLSQHSSTSQPDDSSPYARVRSHAYDKVRPAEEHPYAQIAKSMDENENRTTTSSNNLNAANNSLSDGSSSSSESLRDTVDSALHQQVIPAASAIAGRVSASQELPYMTPPIVQTQQHFSGDSQDSSKGYTSISVREPLANILAQTKKQNAQNRRSDSHYTTVSDDDDEMYAAIEDPNQTYTSGSETYAQIQPTQEPLVVSVEVNPIPIHATITNQPLLSLASHSIAGPSNSQTPRNSIIDTTPEMVHSRQESTSSCATSVSNIIGSPKPEKRQANSPLPPTPKSNNQYQSNLTGSSNSISILTGRSSVTSNADQQPAAISNQRHASRDNVRVSFGDIHEDYELKVKNISKNLEGMYAKVMKKNKLSNLPADTSPPQFRKLYNDQLNAQSAFLSDPDLSHAISLVDSMERSAGPSTNTSPEKIPTSYSINDYETIDKRQTRGNLPNYSEKTDPAYETIPADLQRTTTKSNVSRNILGRVSTPPGLPTQIRSQQVYAGGYDDSNSEPGYESLPDQSSLSNDPGYETVVHSETATKKDGSEYDPNYETLRPTIKYNQPSEYAEDASGVNAESGYSCIKKATTATDDNNVGYASTNSRISTRFEHGYASIRDNDEAQHKYEEDIYTSIPHESITVATTLPPSTSNYSIGSDGKKMSSPSSDSDTNTSIQYNRMKGGDAIGTNSNYESSTASDSDSNYEILRHKNDKFGDGVKYPIYNEADIKYDTLKRSGSFTKHD